MPTRKVTKDEWIKGSFCALKEAGEGAIAVEPLARRLGVSKGSFYWHFSNLADLKAQMIGHWETAATQNVIAEVDGLKANPLAQLERLLNIAISDRDAPYGGPTTEAAIRVWATHDKSVAATCDRVEEARQAYLEHIICASGLGAKDAKDWARLVLFAYQGSAYASAEARRNLVDHLLSEIRAAIERAPNQ